MRRAHVVRITEIDPTTLKESMALSFRVVCDPQKAVELAERALLTWLTTNKDRCATYAVTYGID